MSCYPFVVPTRFFFFFSAEMEMGHFDESGHFIERGFNQSDAWLEEMDEANAQVIGGAKRRFIKPLELNDEEDDQGEAQTEKKPSTGQLAAWADELRKMLADDKETVAGLLKRLAQEKRAKRGSKTHHVKADPLFARPVARQKEGEKIAHGQIREAYACFFFFCRRRKGCF